MNFQKKILEGGMDGWIENVRRGKRGQRQGEGERASQTDIQKEENRKQERDDFLHNMGKREGELVEGGDR